MNRVLIPFTAILLLSFGAASCSSDESKAETAATATSASEAPALPADVAKIGEASKSATPETTSIAAAGAFSATGEFVSPVTSNLSPKMPGRVAKLYVDEGAHVHRGQPVLELETDYIRLNLRAADAEVARARAVRDEAGRDLERKRGLAAKGSVPQATFDRSRAAYESSNASVSAAEAQAALLRQQLADATLRSPVDGVVAEKRTDVGARLGDNGVAFVVVQLSPLRLRFAVPERYLGKVGPGDTVVAHVDPYPNEEFKGTIRTVGGVIDPKTRTMFAEAEFANRDGRLRPGLFARIEAKLD